MPGQYLLDILRQISGQIGQGFQQGVGYALDRKDRMADEARKAKMQQDEWNRQFGLTQQSSSAQAADQRAFTAGESAKDRALRIELAKMKQKPGPGPADMIKKRQDDAVKLKSPEAVERLGQLSVEDSPGVRIGALPDIPDVSKWQMPNSPVSVSGPRPGDVVDWTTGNTQGGRELMGAATQGMLDSLRRGGAPGTKTGWLRAGEASPPGASPLSPGQMRAPQMPGSTTIGQTRAATPQDADRELVAGIEETRNRMQQIAQQNQVSGANAQVGALRAKVGEGLQGVAGGDPAPKRIAAIDNELGLIESNLSKLDPIDEEFRKGMGQPTGRAVLKARRTALQKEKAALEGTTRTTSPSAMPVVGGQRVSKRGSRPDLEQQAREARARGDLNGLSQAIQAMKAAQYSLEDVKGF